MLETRRARRYDCDEAVDCEIQGRIRMAYLKDISLLGGRLQGVHLPPVGTLVRISPAFHEFGRHWIFAQVCWLRRGEVEEAGIRFLEPGIRIRNSWVSGLVEDTDPERRRSIRVNSELHFEVKIAGVRRPLEATSLDISQGGAQVLLPNVIRPGTLADVTVCLPWSVIDLPAQVVRQASLESPHHSLRFLKVEPGAREVLECHLRSQVAAQKTQHPSGVSFLKLFDK